jgi:hypothetical protein
LTSVRAVHLAMGCAVLVLAGSACCFFSAAEHPHRVDFGPLVDRAPAIRTSEPVAALPGFEVIASGGIQQDDGRPRSDGIRELLLGERSYPGGEHVEIRVMVHDSAAFAAADFAFFCDRFGGDDANGAEREGTRTCWTPVIESREDPAGMCIAHGTYYSYAGLQMGELVIQINERGPDVERVSGNEAIRELASALSD